MQPEIITGHISSLAFGGQGILRHEGLVVFVPFTAPGDEVRVLVLRRKKSFAEGELLDILSPGPSRQAARCPYFGVCGGCQLQHLQYAEQLRQKQQFVTDALQRIGRIQLPADIDIEAAEQPWAYRRQVRLTLTSTDGYYAAGYVRHDLKGVLPVNMCPIFIDEQNNLLKSLQDYLQQLPVTELEDVHITLLKAAKERFLLLFEFPKKMPENFEQQLQRWIKQRTDIAGAVVECGEERSVYGDTLSEFEIDGLKIRYALQAFVQNHPAQSLKLYQEIVRLATLCQPKTILDLYCGIGVSSLFLARAGWPVTGVEGNPQAVTLAIENAQGNALSQTQFLHGEVAKIIPNLLLYGPELVLVNPPRTGLDPDSRAELLDAPPKHLIYVSCMPSTLARDLAAFQEIGFKLTSCRAYDMFPQTTHVETIALMQREESP